MRFRIEPPAFPVYNRAGAVGKRTLTDYVGTLDDEQLETASFILQEHCGLFVTEAVEGP